MGGRGLHLHFGQVIFGKLGEGHLVLGLPVPSPYLLHALDLGDDLLLHLCNTAIGGVVIDELCDHLPPGGWGEGSRVAWGGGSPPLLCPSRVQHHCFDQELDLCIGPIRVHGNRGLDCSRLLEC